MTRDRAALKGKLHARMQALEEAELAAAIEHYEAHMAESRLDGREQHDNDDIADSTAEVNLAQGFEHPVEEHQAKVAAIRAMDFSATSVVRPGAAVIVGGKHFVVSVATARFDCEGETWMGISPQSPIYMAMEGLSAGEGFRMGGREMVIDEVF
ncbi:hypothetical protein [Marinibacterium sp. SX1]|uniref:hypothetical protein n=1 Tax=Marinibacterium sp. SX1 TaxID=3388424 RepID=UPI003D16824E